MKSSSLVPVTALVGCLAISTMLVSPGVMAAPPAKNRHREIMGVFSTSDGTQGTYTETYTVAANVTTDTIVYTRTFITILPVDAAGGTPAPTPPVSNSNGTATDTITVTANDDGTRAVVVTHLGFDATVPSTYASTLSSQNQGGATGTGTFTLADGTTGTLISTVFKDGPANITSTNFTTAGGVATRELDIEERFNGGDTAKTLTVDAEGRLIVSTVVRDGGLHHHHP